MLETIILHYLTPALVTIVGGFLMRLLNTITNKIGLEISDQTKQQLKDEAIKQVLAVEEMAANALKAGRPIAGSSKLTQAVNAVTAKFPDIAKPEILTVINAAIASLPNIGATGNL